MRELITRLIAWYDGVRKPMPWREDPTPYHVWLSEIMLQQTRIEAALPYYLAFIREIPDVETLARTDDEKLMKLWQGLGYYARARHLKEAAQAVVKDFGGRLPRDAATLKTLPGIGDYTAGAIASIAFGQPSAAVDGNVLRVMARLHASRENVLDPKVRKSVTAALEAVYPTGDDAGKLTEALMELGETVCVPGVPRCAECPVAAFCEAKKRGIQDELPIRIKNNEKRTENITVFMIENGSRYAVRRRPGKGLLAGLWEFPNEPDTLSAEEAKRLLEKEGLCVECVEPCGESRHVFTHIVWNMTGFRVRVAGRGGAYEWKTPDEILNDCAVPSAFSYYLKKMGDV